MREITDERFLVPSAHRAVAESMRVADPQREWVTLLAKRGGAEPTSAQWLGWCRAAAKARPVAAAPKPWQAPLDWDDAERLDPKREIAIAESAKILALLEDMSPTPTPGPTSSSDETKLVDPICTVCWRICELGRTMHVQCEAKKRRAEEGAATPARPLEGFTEAHTTYDAEAIGANIPADFDPFDKLEAP